MRRSSLRWALSTVAPWLLGGWVLVSITADAGVDASAGYQVVAATNAAGQEPERLIAGVPASMLSVSLRLAPGLNAPLNSSLPSILLPGIDPAAEALMKGRPPRDDMKSAASGFPAGRPRRARVTRRSPGCAAGRPPRLPKSPRACSSRSILGVLPPTHPDADGRGCAWPGFRGQLRARAELRGDDARGAGEREFAALQRLAADGRQPRIRHDARRASARRRQCRAPLRSPRPRRLPPTPPLSRSRLHRCSAEGLAALRAREPAVTVMIKPGRGRAAELCQPDRRLRT